MNAFAAHFSYDFRTGIRNKTLLLMNYLLPVGFYLMMGLIMPALNPSFLEFMIPAMVVFAVLAATVLGLPEPLVSARDAGIFRSYRINGVPPISIVTVPALTTSLHLLIVAALVTVSAPLLFGALLPVNWAGYAISFFALGVACTGTAVLIGVVSVNARLQVLWSQLVFIPSMLLGGMMIRSADLPESAGVFARLLPATHAMNAFDALAMGHSSRLNEWVSVIVLLIGGVLGFTLAVYLFRWNPQVSRGRRHPALAMLVLVPYLATLPL